MVEAIVRALALSDPVPSFLVLDSPASSLDLRRRRVGVIHSLHAPDNSFNCAHLALYYLNPLSLDFELSPAIAHASMRAGVFLDL